MDNSKITNELAKVKEQITKDLSSELQVIYDEELPNIITSKNYSDLGAALKKKEGELLRPFVHQLEKTCEELATKALVDSGLPLSNTMYMWHKVSEKINSPDYKLLDDKAIRKKNFAPNNGNVNKCVKPFSSCVVYVICVLLLIFAPKPVKLLAGLGGVFKAGHAFCQSKKRNTQPKQSMPELNNILKKQQEENASLLNAYVESVITATLEAGRTEK